ncbi:hydrolase [Sulfurimonas sp. SWIR-19]|uniref:hydrolase n=1 Tax=Sulfurimonas sp. SWIR-19 TaxID=2878390 RepID=UPI001CF0E568|nr:hydrolase [Sulfurimonas sp. SWIR-19]UCN00339.1 hydrolase [Sulfurimonas sp. SWIR-19]
MNFKPSFLLKNRHLQTLYASLFRKVLVKNFEIETFTLSDGDFLECYWKKIDNHTKTTPVVILFHGLAGSYKSPYIQGTVKELKEAGFSSVVMHFRGCSGKQNLKPRSYHSGDTQDAFEFIQAVSKRYPRAKIFSVGFSLGANMLLKLLGEKHSTCKLTAAVAVSAPMLLDKCATHINKGFAKFYQKILLKDLKRDLEKKYESFNMEQIISLQRNEIKKLKNFWEFDNAYTAPVHGFCSAREYYKKSSCRQYLKEIKIPTLIIHAKDDPFMPATVLPTKDEISQSVHLEISEHGGHVGFVSGSIFHPEYWMEKKVVKFFYLRA